MNDIFIEYFYINVVTCSILFHFHIRCCCFFVSPLWFHAKSFTVDNLHKHSSVQSVLAMNLTDFIVICRIVENSPKNISFNIPMMMMLMTLTEKIDNHFNCFILLLNRHNKHFNYTRKRYDSAFRHIALFLIIRGNLLLAYVSCVSRRFTSFWFVFKISYYFW